jgi:hypothetical protein
MKLSTFHLLWTAGGPTEWLGLQSRPLTNSPEMETSSSFVLPEM